MNDFKKGHRKRLIERFLKKELESITKVEIFELILFLSIKRKDVKDIANVLAKKYKTLSEFFNSPKDLLKNISGIGDTTIFTIKLIKNIVNIVGKEEVGEKLSFKSPETIFLYYKNELNGVKKEILKVMFFDAKNKLILEEEAGNGSITHLPIHPREIIFRCLQLGAVGIILIHNHPSGDPSPSQSDIISTKDLINICEKLQIKIHDHIIIGENSYFSMKLKGII